MRMSYSASTARTRSSCLRTWVLLHKAAFPELPKVPPFPLTVDKIVRVAALFKVGGYLSFANYLGRAKSEHLAVSETSTWTAALDRASKEATRSVLRGAGAARQSQPLDIVRVADVSLALARDVYGSR